MTRIADEGLRDRARAQFQRPREFSHTTFLAALDGLKSNMKTGTLDLTFSVGAGEKDAALAVTDAPGELLLITVERVSMKGSRHAHRNGEEVRDQGPVGGPVRRRGGAAG